MSGIKDWMESMLFTSAVVTSATDIANGFRLIELEGPALTKSRSAAGDKIQVRMSTLGMRTYTPVAWDAARGRTKLCAYVHGSGPGTRWARAASVGDPCSFFGPRRSVSFAKLRGDVVLFGDETSIGVGAALRGLRPQGSHLVFEASAAGPVQTVVDTLGLSDAHVIERTADDAHLARASERIAKTATSGETTVVLTGRAASIVRLRQRLRDTGLRSFVAKAYWAEGRTGLD